MLDNLWIALALLLVIEGVLPFLNPDALKKACLRLAQTETRVLRVGGLVSMLTGIALLYIVN